MQEKYRLPTITAYNRLEATPRDSDFDRSLQAEIRDALWMLTRQWQIGEFQGEDAASPVSALILGEHTPIDRVGLGASPVQPYDDSLPLEAAVEAEQLRDNLFLAVQIARYFLKLMQGKSFSTTYITLLIQGYLLNYVPDANDTDGRQLNDAVKTKLFDGCALLRNVTTTQGAGTVFSAWLISKGVPQPDQDLFNGIGIDLANWFKRNYSQGGALAPAAVPTAAPVPGSPASSLSKAWEPAKLEYQFDLACSPPAAGVAQKVLSADQFDGLGLDWYSFDINTNGLLPLPQAPVGSSVVENLVSFIPAPVSFKGMPNPRFWMMEDNQTDFGKIDSSPTGLLHLLLAEFGLIYGNDWFMLPYPLAVNNICEIKGLLITDVFGEHILIDAAGSGTDSNWQRWAMFHQTDTNPQAPVNKLFYLAPATGQMPDNDPLEQVNFLRDEVASLVWAVEDSVPSQSGKGVNGDAMALRTTMPAPFVPAGTAAIRYVLGTTVPDNWIPFIPVHIAGSVTEIQFQRATMAGAKGPLGQILTENPAPYYINEEQIPRSGVIVSRSFKRARWFNGRTYLWLGRSKVNGKGEGWSNLKFDQIVDIPPPAPK
jgi:hypothetical protein